MPAERPRGASLAERILSEIEIQNSKERLADLKNDQPEVESDSDEEAADEAKMGNLLWVQQCGGVVELVRVGI